MDGVRLLGKDVKADPRDRSPQQGGDKCADSGIFPTFFLSGFECSTFLWKGRGRRDLVAETQHMEFLEVDHSFLASIGIAVTREGIPWPFVDDGDTYDFSRIDPLIDSLNRHKLLPIWDLCHYGYPDALDPFSDSFPERFAAYAKAAAAYVVPRLRGPHFFTPINEITFFAWMAGEWAWAAPFGTTREQRFRLREQLCRASILGAKAIREVDAQARMVHIDPLVNVVAPRDRPDLEEAARHETYEDTFLAWDIIAGKKHAEWGGAPEILDIVGVNCYSFGQMEYREQGPHAALPPDDDRIVPLGDLLSYTWKRYGRPMIVGETSGLESGRAHWLCDIVQESLAAVRSGIDLHGVCLFPAVDMQDWHTGKWVHNGLCDLVEENGRLMRHPARHYVEELHRWQKILNRVTELDEDPFSNPVDLTDIRKAAAEMCLTSDANWS
jgi:beta-glucosidase/6-phospho-beta-glucosidase/beta-galactosidase